MKIPLTLAQPLLVVLITGGLIFFAWISFDKMGSNFLPAFREPSALVATTLDPGSSLKTSSGISDVAMERLLAIPGVKKVGFRAGRAERGDHVVPVSTVEFDVEFDHSVDRTREEIIADIRKTMSEIPGTFSAMSGPLADRVGHMLSGVSAKVAVKIFGPDLDELRRLGTEIADVARDIPGLEEARPEQQATVPQLRIATLVGFIAVGGIAARNNIMLLSHYLHLMKHEGESFTPQMIMRGTEERLVPILMTAISAGLALVPLVLAADEPGKEILNPVAIVIVGGLISSTLLGLAVTPALYYRFGEKASRKSLERGASS